MVDSCDVGGGTIWYAMGVSLYLKGVVEVPPLKIIALIMRRKPLAEGIAMALKSHMAGELKTHIITNHKLACAYIEQYQPELAVVEIAESGPYDATSCLELCDEIRRQVPFCKLLTICPESDKDEINQCVSAKRRGMIDDFVFYDASLDYLVSKILSI
ncbi:MAG: hypothetical protein ACOX8S_08945 [Christensenellales bacterium]